MKRYRPGSKAQPFPRRRPSVTIRPSTARPFCVDCSECRRLLMTPEVGLSSLSATYRASSKRPGEWELWYVDHRRGERAAGVHWVKGVENT